MNFNNETEYGSVITMFLKQNFPEISFMFPEEKVKSLAALFLGTKETRYGPMPDPEHQVKLRETIRFHVENNLPIPILIPWGSIKPGFNVNPDVAEVMTIKRLVCLARAAKQIHPAGVEMRIRIEDLSAYTLFQNEAGYYPELIDRYAENMRILVNNLAFGERIHVVLETDAPRAAEYRKMFDQLQPLMYEYLRTSHDIIKADPEAVCLLSEWEELFSRGWKGIIPAEQRQHYYDSYHKMYGYDERSNIERLSFYLAGSWAKHQLKILGTDGWNNGFIQISYVPPVPGVPRGFDLHYLYYRTLPLSMARTHIAPWRAKGYLLITDTEVKAKICSWSDKQLLSEMHDSTTIVVIETPYNILVQTDYILE